MRDYGPLSYARVGPFHLYMISDAQLVEQLLLAEHGRCIKDANTRTLGRLLGQSLLSSDGDAWKRRRKFVAPLFLPRRMDSYLPDMTAVARGYVESLRAGESRDFHADSMRMALEIAGRTLCGVSAGAEATRFAELLDVVVGYFEQRLFSFERVVPLALPTPAQRRFRRAKAELDALLRGLVARARAVGSESDHLLARMDRERASAGLGEQELLDELLTMLVAGHETTALALTYTVYLLSHHRDARARVRTELRGSDDLQRLPYLDAVLRESMRLYPPAYALGREVVEPFELGGYLIPARSALVVSPFAIHRHAAYFDAPEQFRPERWLEDRVLPRFAYMPFGGGPRVCVGTHFAWLEAMVVLANLLREVELDVQPGFELELSAVVTLRPRAGLPVTVSHPR